MNPIVRKLAEESGLLYEQIGPSVETRYTKKKEETLAAFAELIVKAVFDRIANERFEVYEPVVKSVKEHFGVKND